MSVKPKELERLVHCKDIPEGTERAILKQAGII